MNSWNWVRVSLVLVILYGIVDLSIGYALDTRTTLLTLIETLRGLSGQTPPI